MRRAELDFQDSFELLRLTLTCGSMESTALRLGSIARTGQYNFSGTIVHRHTGDWLERSPPEVGLAGIHDGTCNET